MEPWCVHIIYSPAANLKDSVAQAWRALANASQDTSEFIRAECARFSLRVSGTWTSRSDSLRPMRDRMAQYNHAWSTLQHTFGQFFTIPQTTDDTSWAGSLGWQPGSNFMGESNGYVFNAISWADGPQFRAQVSLYQVPSLRTGKMGLDRVQINVALASHYVKAVAVDSVAGLVGILE